MDDPYLNEHLMKTMISDESHRSACSDRQICRFLVRLPPRENCLYDLQIFYQVFGIIKKIICIYV